MHQLGTCSSLVIWTLQDGVLDRATLLQVATPWWGYTKPKSPAGVSTFNLAQQPPFYSDCFLPSLSPLLTLSACLKDRTFSVLMICIHYHHRHPPGAVRGPLGTISHLSFSIYREATYPSTTLLYFVPSLPRYHHMPRDRYKTFLRPQMSHCTNISPQTTFHADLVVAPSSTNPSV